MDVLHTPLLTPPVYLLVLRGAVDAGNTDSLENEFDQALASGLPLLIDLSALTFGDQELLRLLLHAHIRRQAILIGPLSPTLQHRLAVTGTEDVFTIQPTLDQALAGIRSETSADDSQSTPTTSS